ncbi:MAG: hypothetical protein KW793_01405 [Candidatus Doudnabacteria bacterium]|nr:hypothetical protein [Candidatus Doudnabacteria bacterium]
MTTAEKSKKLLEYSVVLKASDKKSWVETLPKMTEKQVQTLYDVLVSEVKAWKKEGISIIPDLSVELQLLPEEKHGASVNSLKEALTGVSPIPPKLALPKPPTQPEPETEEPVEEMPLEEELPKPEMPLTPNSAWMLSNKVVVPKSGATANPHPKAVPHVRNRLAKHGLAELKNIRSIDDLKKVEPAHLRQGPLVEQIAFIKQIISKLSRENDVLPISIIPVFEKSPLFQTYLKAGAMLIEKNTGDTKIVIDEIMEEIEAEGMDSLTQQEFEAVADLKKELESLAGF